jgi:predicted nucleotidyltransferase
VDKAAAIKIAQQYANEVVKEMRPAKILLFGSYANGNASEESDIDIAVVFDGLSGDWFDACIKLSSLTWNVSTYIEPVVLDIQNNKDSFVQEVLRTGELIYEQT